MPLARLIRFLTLLALLLAPVGMMSAHAAAAVPTQPPTQPMAMGHGGAHAAPAAADHCAPDGQDQSERSKQSADCTIFCAAMAAPDGAMAAGPAFAGLALRMGAAISGNGLNPESEPPPPRSS